MSTNDYSEISIQSQLKLLFEELKSQRGELSSLREDVQGNAFSVSSEVKRLKTEKDIKWAHIGNRVQFEFNSEVEELLSQIDWALQHGKSEYASEVLEEAQEKIRERNKLIRIADSSEGG